MMKSKILALAAAAMIGTPALADEIRNPLKPSESWDEMKADVIGDAELLDGTSLLAIEAPYRAHDAATVPITVREIDGDAAEFVKLILVVDENPAPVVAEFEIGPSMGDLDLEARMRINAYSNVRAIAVTDAGEHYMVGRFVKASGGCSAPALKDADAALAGVGKMKLRLFDEPEKAEVVQSGMRREAQVMVRHPNYSGMQMNQLTQLFIPAHFVDELEVTQGDALVFRMTSGISISEDPSFRFKYIENGAGSLHIRARDTDGEIFERDFPTTPDA